jgi:hypothetical protein
LHTNRILIACVAALVVSLVLLQHPGRSRGATPTAQGSSNIAVIPGFAPAPYPGTYGVPRLPLNSPQLSSYTFTALPPNQVSAATLSSYDTVLLYGIRWSDIPAAGQSAIDAFAATHKVVIWDADDTGAQSYTNFVYPFSTLASGEGAPGGASVVSYPTIPNVLASDSPASPYYLDPTQLVDNKHTINHMNVMHTGTKNWVPALQAADAAIPGGGWVVAWSYGKISDGTGLLVYSGFDADALIDEVSPNYALKEMALDFAAPFQQTPAPCAPDCKLPTGGGGHTYTTCKFAKRIPTHWVHGRVPIILKTTLASGITAAITTRTGRTLAHGRGTKMGLVRLVVQTKKLRSNRSSRLRAAIFVKGQLACTNHFRLKVDNIPPRLLSLSTTSADGVHLLNLSVSENSSISVVRPGATHHRWISIAANRSVSVRIPARIKTATLIVRDRAGNTILRKLAW